MCVGRGGCHDPPSPQCGSLMRQLFSSSYPQALSILLVCLADSLTIYVIFSGGRNAVSSLGLSRWVGLKPPSSGELRGGAFYGAHCRECHLFWPGPRPGVGSDSCIPARSVLQSLASVL